MESMIRDIKLAPSGHDKINWVKNFMPVMAAVDKEFSVSKPFAGKKMVITLHLEAKTAYMAEIFHHAGAEVAITGSNPLSTQDDVAAALVEDGLHVFAWHDCTPEEYDTFINKALDIKPRNLLDHVTHDKPKPAAVVPLGIDQRRKRQAEQRSESATVLDHPTIRSPKRRAR